jgi:hypothetical protein
MSTYCHVYDCDYRWVLDWCLDLLESLIQCMAILHSSLLHTHVFTSCCSVVASSSGCSCLNYQLFTAMAHNDWTSAVLWLANSITRWPTQLNWLNQSYVTTDGQSASLSWNKAPIWGLRPDLYYCQTVAGLLMWGALSDKRTGLSFARVKLTEWLNCPAYNISARTTQKTPFLFYCI